MIRALPEDVQRHLRSGVAITTATQCVEELVLNAIDAKATCVAVRVNLDCLKIQVVDNGTGVEYEQLPLLGNRYATSKCHTVSDLNNLCYFGYRGEALASISDTCAVLEITTRTKKPGPTHCKMFKNGKELKVFESSIPRPSSGTTVTVHDLFHNFPVRKQSMNASLEFEMTRRRLEGLALFQPGVSISLRNDVTGCVVLQTHRCSSMITTFTHLFGTSKARLLKDVQESQGQFTVEGYIGIEGHIKKDLQFVYINGRLVLKTMIHKILNQCLRKSAICNKKYGQNNPSPDIGAKVSVLSSPVKFVDKYPIYIMNVRCPFSEYDITFDPAKTLVQFKDWDTLLECTTDLVNTFLKKESLNTYCPGPISAIADADTAPSTSSHQDQKRQMNISPSDLKDTVVSKKARRMVRVEEQEFVTPESVPLETWKAENESKQKPGRDPDVDSSGACEVSIVNSSDSNGDVSHDTSSKSNGRNGNEILAVTNGQSEYKRQHIEKTVRYTAEGKHRAGIRKKDEDLALQSSTSSKKSNDCKDNMPKRAGESTNVSQPDQPHSSLMEYRKLIGKHHTTRFSSVDESLKKIAKLMERQSDKSSKKCRSLQTSTQHDDHVTLAGTDKGKHVLKDQSNSRRRDHQEQRPSCSQRNKSETSSCEGRKKVDTLEGCKLKYAREQTSKSVHVQETLARNQTRSVGVVMKPVENKSKTIDTTAAKLSRLVKQRGAIVTIEPEQTKPTGKNQSVAVDIDMMRDSGDTNAHVGPPFQHKPLYQNQESHVDTVAKAAATLRTLSNCSFDISADVNFPSTLDEQAHIGGSVDINEQFLDTGANLREKAECDVFHRTLSAQNNIDCLSKDDRDLKQYGSQSDQMFDRQEMLVAVPLNVEHEFNDKFINDCISNAVATANQGENQFQNSKDKQNIVNNEMPDYFTQGFSPSIAQSQSGLSDIMMEARLSQGFVPQNQDTDTLMQVASSATNTPVSEGFSPQLHSISESVSAVIPGQCHNNNHGDSCHFDDETCDEQENVGKDMFQYDCETERDKLSHVAAVDNSIQVLVTDQKLGETKSHSYHQLSEVANETVHINFESDSKSSVEGDDDLSIIEHKRNESKLHVKPSHEYGGTAEDNTLITRDIVVDSENKNEIVETVESAQESSDNVSLPSLSCLLLPAIESSNSKSPIEERLQSTNPITFSDIFSPSQTQSVSRNSMITDDRLPNVPNRFADLENKTCNSQVDSTNWSSCSYLEESQFIESLNAKRGTNEREYNMKANTHQVKTELGADAANEKNATDDPNIGVNPTDEPIHNMDDTMNIDLESIEGSTSEVPNGLAKSFDRCQDCHKSASGNVHTKTENVGSRISGAASSTVSVNNNSKDVTMATTHTSTRPDDNVGLDTQWQQVRDPTTGKNIYVHSHLGMTVTSSQWKGSDCPMQDTSHRVSESREKPKMNPLLKERHMHEFRSVPGSMRQSAPGTSKPASSIIPQGTSSGSIVVSGPDISSLRTMIMEHFDDEGGVQVKWRGGHVTGHREEKSGSEPMESLVPMWKDPPTDLPQTDVVSAEISGLPSTTVIKTLQNLHPYTFTQDMLADVQVIGQLDNKFIVCIMKTEPLSGEESLVVIDQHAAHERVRLELLTEEAYVDSDPESGRLAPFMIDPARLMQFTRDEVRIMTSYEEEFERIGVQFSVDSPQGSTVHVHSIPACLVKQEVTEGKKQKQIIYWKTIETLIKDHTELLMSTHGSKGRFPPVIHRVLCSLACHGATKFGDPLSRKECEALVKDLSGCNLPFQCAHGRPSVMPILPLNRSSMHPSTMKGSDVLWKRSKPQLHKISSLLQD